MSFSCNILNHYAGAPSIVRADRVTENTIVAFLQPTLRHEGTDTGAKSFQYGQSSANQANKMQIVVLHFS